MRARGGPIVVLAVVLATLAPSPAGADELAALRASWEAGKYLEVVRPLADYREKSYGRTVEVDYMLGTAACRVPQLRSDGAAILARILYNYVLSQAGVVMVQNELQRCGAVVVPGTIIFTDVSGQRRGVSGKTFFWPSGNNAVASGPAVAVRAMPASEFAARRFTPAQADAAVAKVRSLVGEGFGVRRAGPFVLAAPSHRPEADLRLIADTLEHFLRFFAREFEARVPEHLITVYVVDHMGALEALAEKVHGIRISPNTIAYSFRDDVSVAAAFPQTQAGSLVHELAHLVARHSFGDIPAWLDEGLAALYEVSTFERDGRVAGVDNWRRAVLTKLWSVRPTIAKLVEMNASQFANEDEQYELQRQAANHATARYLMLYLQEQGRLAPLYRAFRDRKPTNAVDPRLEAVQILERVAGASAAELDARFVKWFQDRNPVAPPGPPPGPPPAIEKYEPAPPPQDLLRQEPLRLNPQQQPPR